ncbi:hypothetical protein MUU77_03295 [Pseudoxanthomonas sp. F37]|jgi:hypothetical protein|uniref:hypothetical protein n=1 Tax=Pseudoxanthomonas TaxID=83618 RepID=UPI001FD3476B|nr:MULTISPECIES: hypothetical protein [Pseudoxanthomonas]UOV04347.1 hypothetical protein MUU75_14600 [Pseudoxanthomonas mexicana]UOV09345.1 hypothetical protein MUU77_03295 [Pseudoxanthomonas sp. F37]
MSVSTIVEHGCPLTVQTLERVDALGARYWQARAMFRIASGQARVDVVTRSRHATREAAERAALALARENGWGRG